MTGFAAQVLAGGLGEIRTALPYALAAAAAALVVAGVFSVLLFKGIARWRAVRGEVGDDTLAMLRQPQPAPWPDEDTFVDGSRVRDALLRMLEEDGRG
jgi:hypothetical protein